MNFGKNDIFERTETMIFAGAYLLTLGSGSTAKIRCQSEGLVDEKAYDDTSISFSF